MHRVIALAVPAAAAALFSFPAWPCSPVPQGLGFSVAPARDATEIPTNALLHVEANAAPFTATARLLREGAEPLTLDTSFDGDVMVVGLGNLEPNTRYTVEVDDQGIDGSPTDPVTFTTGSDEDTIGPVFAGEPATAVDHQPAPAPWDAFNTCGVPVETNVITVTVPAVNDDHGVAAVRLLRVLDNGARELRASRVLIGNPITLFDTQDEAGSTRYELVAVDHAGNESEALAFTVDVSGFGCSATAVSSSPSTFALVGVLLATTRMRRRGQRGLRR